MIGGCDSLRRAFAPRSWDWHCNKEGGLRVSVQEWVSEAPPHRRGNRTETVGDHSAVGQAVYDTRFAEASAEEEREKTKKEQAVKKEKEKGEKGKTGKKEPVKKEPTTTKKRQQSEASTAAAAVGSAPSIPAVHP